MGAWLPVTEAVSMAESHPREGPATWAPGAEVRSAEEPALLFSLLSILPSLPGHVFEELFSLMGNKPGGGSYPMEVREAQCFLQCFLVQQKSKEAVLSRTWAWSHTSTPRLTVRHPSSGEDATC